MQNQRINIDRITLSEISKCNLDVPHASTVHVTITILKTVYMLIPMYLGPLAWNFFLRVQLRRPTRYLLVQCPNESSALYKKMGLFERVLIEVSVKINMGVSLKVLVFANLEY